MAAARGIPFDDGINQSMTNLEIHTGEGFVTMIITYITLDGHITACVHGTRAGERTDTVTLAEGEYLTALSGYFHNDGPNPIVHSLTFESNIRDYGPFGSEEGINFRTLTNGRIVGFYGASDESINSISAHFGPPPP